MEEELSQGEKVWGIIASLEKARKERVIPSPINDFFKLTRTKNIILGAMLVAFLLRLFVVDSYQIILGISSIIFFVSYIILVTQFMYYFIKDIFEAFQTRKVNYPRIRVLHDFQIIENLSESINLLLLKDTKRTIKYMIEEQRGIYSAVKVILWFIPPTSIGSVFLVIREFVTAESLVMPIWLFVLALVIILIITMSIYSWFKIRGYQYYLHILNYLKYRIPK
ncbi:hypothetical protein [Pelistega ratti]|uniref:hypothetical protein n=1 Tax=Pelistega ratti TaxID=2652177 RepID=UPI0013586F5B|nr:hypothetical protein [Pelistega ratti]